MSRSTSCDCRATVPVLMTSFFPVASAIGTPAVRYARLLPTPVGASAMPMPPVVASALDTTPIMWLCARRVLKPGVLACRLP